jgi:hypothetical protein
MEIMAYDRKKIFEQAKEQIVSKRLIFVEEVVAFIGIAKPTFYDFFPIDSNEMNELKGLIETNKISLKTSMRKKWYDSDNATLQMGLMKLIATPEEHKKLSQNYTDHTTDGKAITLTPPTAGENPLIDNLNNE